ncbi:MAG: hypothetical protein ACLPX7_24100 [Xanthobacteraceae bacterium]
MGPIEAALFVVNGRWEIGGYGSPAPRTVFPVAAEYGTEPRADWPSALAGLAAGAAADARCAAVEAIGALPGPFTGCCRGALLRLCSGLAATGRGVRAVAAAGLDTVALGCEPGVCGTFA